MINSFIGLLTATPTPDKAPLYRAVNTQASLNTQFETPDETSQVRVFDTRPDEASELEAPYVRVWYAGSQQNVSKAIRSGAVMQTDSLVVRVECVAVGQTKSQAAHRADKLKLAVWAAISNLRGTIAPGLLRLADDGGTGSYEEVESWEFDPDTEQTEVGPGVTNRPDDRLWQAVRVLKINVWVTTSLSR